MSQINWKYILIVAILATIVGGGIWGYCYLLKHRVYYYHEHYGPTLEREIIASVVNQQGITASVITEDHREREGDLGYGSLWLYISFKNSERKIEEYLLTDYSSSKAADILIDKIGNFFAVYYDFSDIRKEPASFKTILFLKKYSPVGKELISQKIEIPLFYRENTLPDLFFLNDTILLVTSYGKSDTVDPRYQTTEDISKEWRRVWDPNRLDVIYAQKVDLNLNQLGPAYPLKYFNRDTDGGITGYQIVLLDADTLSLEWDAVFEGGRVRYKLQQRISPDGKILGPTGPVTD